MLLPKLLLQLAPCVSPCHARLHVPLQEVKEELTKIIQGQITDFKHVAPAGALETMQVCK